MLAITLTAVILTLLPWFVEAQTPIGQIKFQSLTGFTTIERQGETLIATEGTLLHSGDTLRTDKLAGSVAITMIDGTRLVLKERSHFVIKDFQWNATTQQGTMATRLQSGAMAVDSGILGKSPDGVRIETPKSVVNVTAAQMAIRLKSQASQ